MTETKQKEKPKSRYLLAAEYSAIALALAACWLIHWLPFDFLALVVRLRWEYSVAVVVCLLAGRLAIQLFLPRAFSIATVVYYIAVSAYCLVLGYYVLLLDSVFFWLCVLYGVVLAMCLIYLGRRKEPIWIFAAITLVYMASVPYGSAKVVGLIFLAAMLPAVSWLQPVRIGRPALLFAGLIAMLCMRLTHFYFGGDPMLVSSVTSQPGIERVLSIDKTLDSAWRQMGDQIRFAADNMAGTRTLVGTESGTVALEKYGRRYKAKKILRSNCSDGVVYYPKENLVILGDYGGQKLLLLDDASMAIKGTFNAPGHAFTNLWLFAKYHWVLTGDDFTRDIGIFSIPKRKFERMAPAKASRDALVDEKTGLFIATSLRRVRWIDPKTGATVRELDVPSMQIRLAIDSENRSLYISCFSTGELWRVDLDTGYIQKKLFLERGIRFMTPTEDLKALYVSGYLYGHIFKVTAPSLLIEERIFAGPRVRTLHIAPGSKKLVFGSSLGVFRYRMDRSEPEEEPKKP